MPAYWVARSRILDPVEYKKYTDLVPDIMQDFEGRILSRGARHEVIEGSDYYHRFVVIEFPSYEKALACIRSERYQAAAAFRRNGAGDAEIVILDAGDATPR